MKIRKSVLKLMLVVLGLSLAACQPSRKPKAGNSLNFTEEQRAEAQAKEVESLQKRIGVKQKVLVEQKKLEFVLVSDTKIAARILLDLNQKPKSFIFSIPVTSSADQIEIQDKTSEISDQYPDQNLELSAYKFKSGNVDMIAFEYRFLKVTKTSTESGSQFVLAILNKSLGDKAILKTQFEYPTKSDLKTWATTANVSAMGAQ